MAGTRTPRGKGKRAPARSTSARSSSARRKPPARGRSRRRRGRGGAADLGSLFSGGLPRLPVLDQRQRDVLGLALVAAGVFMGFVLYGDWNGGRAGHGLAVGLGWMLGRARVLAPVALVVGGGALLLRPVLPALRPLRTGALCVFAAVTLALAAGMFGLSERRRPMPGAQWSSAHLQSHGGVLGEALYQLTHRLVQDVGVDILVIFLLLTGVILLTGASIASVIRATGSGVVDTTRMMRRLRERESAAPPGRTSQDTADRGSESPHELIPPEPNERELIVRATHVEAPSHDWADEDEAAVEESPEPSAEPAADDAAPADGAHESEDEEIAGVAHADPDALGDVSAEQLTPQGRLRGAL